MVETSIYFLINNWKTQSRGRSSLLYSPQNFQFCTGKPSPPSAELALSLLGPRNSDVDRGKNGKFAVGLKI